MTEEIKKCNPCQFYGFFIHIDDLLDEIRGEVNVIDIDHEDITNQKLIEK
jgi:hypothetical protein